MTAFTSTLGLSARPALPAAPVPKLKPGHLPPAGLLRDAYLVYVCTQIAESAAARLVAGVPAFQHTGLHKRVGALHRNADDVLASLFGHFDTASADTLNHLTRVTETAAGALVTLAVQPETDDGTLERVAELVGELAGLAENQITPAPL